jgi:hypothetical protein
MQMPQSLMFVVAPWVSEKHKNVNRKCLTLGNQSGKVRFPHRTSQVIGDWSTYFYL